VRRTRLTWGVSSAFALGLVLAAAARAEDAPAVTGIVSASEHEADEGYFAIGSDTMLVARPNSALHRWLRERNGQQVRVTIAAVGAGDTD
jgi:hypothetical protein